MGAREELAAIRERAGRAMPGRWRADQCGGGEESFGGKWVCPGGHANGVWSNGATTDVLRDESTLSSADAEFIAHARTDVPRLVDAVEAVVEIREWIRRAQLMRVEVPMFDIAQRLDGVLAALTTDTKGDAR